MNYPENVQEQIHLFIKNVKYLNKCLIDDISNENKEQVSIVLKHKLKLTLTRILQWYKVYNRSVPDGLIMIYDQYDKLEKIKKKIYNRYTLLNYEINKELYHCLNRIYNL